MNILEIIKNTIMNSESLLFIIAPLSLFVFGVMFISYIGKRINIKNSSDYKLIDDFEKKYIY